MFKCRCISLLQVKELNVLDESHLRAVKRLDSLLKHSVIVGTDDIGLSTKPGLIAEVTILVLENCTVLISSFDFQLTLVFRFILQQTCQILTTSLLSTNSVHFSKFRYGRILWY